MRWAVGCRRSTRWPASATLTGPVADLPPIGFAPRFPSYPALLSMSAYRHHPHWPGRSTVSFGPCLSHRLKPELEKNLVGNGRSHTHDTLNGNHSSRVDIGIVRLMILFLDAVVHRSNCGAQITSRTTRSSPSFGYDGLCFIDSRTAASSFRGWELDRTVRGEPCVSRC